MTTAEVVALGASLVGGAAALAWIAFHLHAWAILGRMPQLGDAPAHPPGEAGSAWPRLSLVVPACNEADTLEAALSTHLAASYPALEVIVVDDRSTDGTGALVDRLAASSPRLRALHLDALPPGWLGKVHALHQGLARATGDWVLFTDADVHLAPGALERAVAYAEREGIDHVAVIPEMRGAGFWNEAVVSAFGGMLLHSFQADRVHGPDSANAVGVGAFNLLRRAALEGTEGLSWLRMEVADDIGVGELVKRGGGRSRVLLGMGQVWLSWYPTLLAMFEGFEKNAFGAIGAYRYTRTAGVTLGVLWFSLGAFAACLYPGGPVPLTLGAAAYGASLLFATRMARRVRRRLVPMLALPLAYPLIALMLVRSAVLCWRRGGILWRGTRYALAELRASRRIQF